jgi:hypothetical protein
MYNTKCVLWGVATREGAWPGKIYMYNNMCRGGGGRGGAEKTFGKLRGVLHHCFSISSQQRPSRDIYGNAMARALIRKRVLLS